MIKFTAPSQEEATRQLASNLPDGKAWEAKNLEGTNVRALVSACAAEFREIQLRIQALAKELNVRLTNDLLPDWEKSAGLPEECSGPLLALEARRQAVIIRLRKIPFVTKEEYESLIFDVTGLTVVITPGAEIELFPLEFPLTFAKGNSFFKLHVGFTDVIGGFPYSFPLPFATGQDKLVRCILEKIAPANVLLLFNNARPPQAELLFMDGFAVMDGTYTMSGTQGSP